MPGARAVEDRVILWLKAAVFLVALSPGLWLFWLGWRDELGANPVEALSRGTGEWTLRLLLATLAVSPLRRLTGWTVLLRYRRMLGLFAFFYGCLHVLTYVVLDQWFDGAAMLDDIVKRPYLTAGMTAFLLLVPLATTSTRGMMLRLGRRWRALHRLIYPAAMLGVVHFLWQAKIDTTEALVYALLLALLLAMRLPWLISPVLAGGCPPTRPERTHQSVSAIRSP